MKPSFPIKNFEARVFIKDPVDFRKKVLQFGGRKIKEGAFTDYIYEPCGKKWDLKERSFKLRVFEEKQGEGSAEFKYYPFEFKDGVKREKLSFDAIIANQKDAFQILEDWNFQELFHFRRTNEVYEIGDQLVLLENIEHLGWMVEVEGDSVVEVEKLLKSLGVFEKRVAKTLPELVSENL